MARFSEINFLEQGRHSRRLAATRRSAQENQPVWAVDQLLQVGMQIELLNRGLEGREQPDGQTDSARGVQDVNAATHALNRLGKIK